MEPLRGRVRIRRTISLGLAAAFLAMLLAPGLGLPGGQMATAAPADRVDISPEHGGGPTGGLVVLTARVYDTDGHLATDESAHVRFYFDPDDGQLLAMELFASEDSDPCELHFSDYRQESGVRWPGRIEVRCGDQVFAVFEISAARK